MAFPSLVAFGGIAPWPGTDRLDQLRTTLHQQSSLKSFVRVIQELPLLWKTLVRQDPSIHSITGNTAAEALSQWITGGAITQTVHDLGNVIRMPLTTIAQIAQYISYLRQRGDPYAHEAIIKNAILGGGIQGLCIGLLSALAVASGKTEDEIGSFAATSVKLAFCIGAYVDLDAHRSKDESNPSTMAVRWKAPTTLEDIQHLASRHPNTYIAVIRDVRDVTMTMPASVVEHFLEDLSEIGASARNIDISGRYHAAVHVGIPQKILVACQANFSPNLDSHCLVRSNTDGHLLSDDDAALSALKCILGERADWYHTMSTAASSLNQMSSKTFVLSIGTDVVPQSVVKSLSVVKAAIVTDQMNEKPISGTTAPSENRAPAVEGYPKDSIAIVGMGCRFPGADSIDEFWNLLTEGKSMLSEIPKARFGQCRSTRSNSNLRYWGNFLRDIEAFDHGFFKKSPREAVSMDPQQRILLQVAYEALESSGYFASSRPTDVGCYIGACATDYDFNVASHPPTAYSAIGTLRSFLSGKLSHYFGWSGPSLVLDTACSSSAVAIHTACTALRTGQCSQALAGGITLMTSPYLFENFTAAHFLSPTGGSKSFSADADGYCRGEGGGLVVLKRLSDALKDDDQILGIIAGSAVNQNANCVPITVPHTSSQGDLYERVVAQAEIEPNQVTFVEAHGTGTPVGDPIEMESIRRVFGGPSRDTPLVVSSAKGNIGHLEGASGVAALIKAILQMEHRIAPRQALFKTLNPKIPALEPDNLCVPASNHELSKNRLAACVNNYGAAGSNAAMIILEPPPREVAHHFDVQKTSACRSNKHPFHLAAASIKSLLAYCAALDEFCNELRRIQNRSKPSQMMSNLSFSLAARLNQDLSFTLTFTASDLDQLQSQLRQQHIRSNAIKQRQEVSPVVMCFGGQVSDKIALDKRLWQECALLRAHLDICDTTLHVLGFPGLYPEIFQTEAVTNVIILHSIIFATQYACAQAWLESGLKVDALVGHSFGQLTALCVSGVLSLEDGLKLVAGRASLMQKYWGPESGTMIAVETNRQTLRELQSVIHESKDTCNFEIACFNGPNSHVVVSDKASADELEVMLIERALRYKMLKVPYGFHSRFTGPILPHLQELASSLTLREPKIPIETCTETASWETTTAKLITDHTREPVFFGQAIQRLQSRLGPCTYLEAGSDSSVVSMARRASAQSSTSNNNFVSMQLNKFDSSELVVDATIALWNTGHRLQFWNFHQLQRRHYDRIRLPSYAWEQSKHWLEIDMSTAWNSGDKTNAHPPTNTVAQRELRPILLSLESTNARGHDFVINPRSEEYQTITGDVESMGSAACPTMLYVDLASRAVRMIDESKQNRLLSMQDFQLHSHSPANFHHSITLELQHLAQCWRFKINSMDGPSHSSKSGGSTCLAEGTIGLRSSDEKLGEDFCRYERLIGRNKIASIADDPRSESIRGNVMYKMLTPIARYPTWFHGVRTLASMDSQVIAKVTIPTGIPKIVSQETMIQLPLLESFLQVASLHANCLHENDTGPLALQFTGADDLQGGPEFGSHCQGADPGQSWDVIAYASPKAGGVAYDMFILNSATSRLALVMLGVHFADFRRPITIKDNLNNDSTYTRDAQTRSQTDIEEVNTDPLPQISQPQIKQSNPVRDPKTSIYEDICSILEKLADISRNQVTGSATFDNLDIDSLMVIEIISELSSLFQIELPIDEMVELTDINSLVTYLHGKGCTGSPLGEDGESSSSFSSSQAPSTGASSPLDSPGDSTKTTPPRSLTPVEKFDSIMPIPETPRVVPVLANAMGIKPLGLGHHGIQKAFGRVRFDFEKHAEQTGAKGFWTDVYPQQANLVCAYVAEAFKTLGCDLASLAVGQGLPVIDTLPRHKHLVAQLRKILVDSGLLEARSDHKHVRTGKPVDSIPIATKFEKMLQGYPLYASETKLLNVTGPLLAECLTGKKDPLPLLFGNRHNLELLADFYANSQMCKAATCLLAEFILSISSAKQTDGILHILEVGAGTGGTTKHLLECLTRREVIFEYTFTDISQSLVSQAKKKFSSFPQMRFMTFDCDQPAPKELLQQFHLVISTNCIHATKNITKSATNILPIIRDDGALCVVEFTRNLYWFDLVFGLLEGWWLFSDGRQHALADERFWKSSFLTAGFKNVSWTDGDSDEAKTLRLICGFKVGSEEDLSSTLRRGVITKRAGIPMEEVVWKQLGTLDLSADIYFPKVPDPPGKKRPIALLIHGGGHFLFGRKDVPMKHIRTLIERGFLPISTDYRLCPETSLLDGPMTDCCDALKWVNEVLPSLLLLGPTVRPDPTKVVSLGWSSGGQLAMSLGYMALAKGIKPPDAVFALYPPSDMESDHWQKPCYPLAAEEEPQPVSDILAGVRERPIVEYAPVSEKRTMALSLTLKDDRARIILHMCWNSQTVPFLVHGLPHKESAAAMEKKDWKYLPPASTEQVQAISPLWQIRQGNYKTPTFIVHGDGDDWLPLSMSERTIEELKSRGIPANLVVPNQCRHAFDLFPVGDPLNTGWTAIEQGYDFICNQLNML